MDLKSTDLWTHSHNFEMDYTHSERRAKWVVLLTAVTMVIEIVAGAFYHSMALLADGWHMGTHMAALGITVFAYFYARHHANDARYSFGTGKVSTLGGFASGVALVVVALLIAMESLQRLVSPLTIQFNEALVVAVVGLGVNLLSMWLLQEPPHHHAHDHPHHHAHDHPHHHAHPHHDHNLRSAYLHVLADALTSVLAIVALLTGKSFGWVWLDPLMGIVGAIIITRWSYGLLQDTSSILLDGQVDAATLAEIRQVIEEDADNKITDLHIWQIAPHQLAMIISIVTSVPRPPDYYKQLLATVEELAHVTIEVCPSDKGN